MSIEFDNNDYDSNEGTMYLTCDTCGEEADYYGTWQDCIDQAKYNGWIIKPSKDGSNTWSHYCCQECKY